jgi:hypothetical protein
MRSLRDGTSQGLESISLALGWLTVSTWRALRANQRSNWIPVRSPNSATAYRLMAGAIWKRVGDARQIGKDGAEVDSDVVHSDNFPKIAAFFVNSGVIGGKRHTGVLVRRRSKSGTNTDAHRATPGDCLATTRISSPIAR